MWRIGHNPLTAEKLAKLARESPEEIAHLFAALPNAAIIGAYYPNSANWRGWVAAKRCRLCRWVKRLTLDFRRNRAQRDKRHGDCITCEKGARK